MMATITVRDLDDALKAKLRVRAAEHGRSMEAEVREILRMTLLEDRSAIALGSRIRERFGGLAADDLLAPRASDPARAADLDR